MFSTFLLISFLKIHFYFFCLHECMCTDMCLVPVEDKSSYYLDASSFPSLILCAIPVLTLGPEVSTKQLTAHW